MSRPAWMTDELDEEWVEPEWEEEDAQDNSQRSQRSRRSAGGSKIQRSTHVYGSVRVASSSQGSGSDIVGSMRERSVRGLLELDGGKHKATTRPRAASESSTPEPSAPVGTFLVREDVAPEPLNIAPGAFKKSGVKNFFTPLALERMFEPPSPPPDGNKVPAPQFQAAAQPETASHSPPRTTSSFHPSSDSASLGTRPTAATTSTSTSPTSLDLSKPPSPGNTTPSPHNSPVHPNGSTPSPSVLSSSPSSVSFIPSPSAGRGPLGTFRLPHRHAPLRPSRLSESHLIKPYASFEADESTSHSSIPKDILADLSNAPEEEKVAISVQEPNHSDQLRGAIQEDDEERLTNDFDFGDDELIVGDDADGDGDEADSILDPSMTDIDVQQLQQRGTTTPVARPAEKSQPSLSENGTPRPDEILDTDIPGLTLFDGRKLSASYQFTFADPRTDNAKKPTTEASSNARDKGKKSKEERKRERDLEHTGTESRPSSRASSIGEDPPARDGFRTPSPGMLQSRDPRLKLFQFQYDTFTRDHLSALVDSIAVGSVGSSPSIQVNTVDFRGEDPRALSTPSDAVRYAKKIKLTPPDEFSDWDGERSEEEPAASEDMEDNSTEPYPRPLSVGRNYADDARNLMQAMRDARSFDGDSAVSGAQQSGEQETEGDMVEMLNLSSGSAANDYRRRGADLMAQLREELSDEEDGSIREGSILSRADGSTNGGSVIIRSLGALPTRNTAAQGPLSPSSLTVNRVTQPSPNRLSLSTSSQGHDSISQLSLSVRSMGLGDQGRQASKPSPRKLLRRLSAADEVMREVAKEGDPLQPPIITIAAASPEPPRARVASRSRVASGSAPRIQSPGPSSSVPGQGSAHTRPEIQQPPSLTRQDMNRFVSSSSTTNTRSNTARSAGSFVKHPGPPVPGVRQIVPSDLPAEALPDRVGRMVYDRQAMRWRPDPDGNVSETEDPFRDFDSFLSNAGPEDEEEGSQPMDEVDEREEEQRADLEQDSLLDPNITLHDTSAILAAQEPPESTVAYDSDVSTDLKVVDVGEASPLSGSDTGSLKLYEPSPETIPAELGTPEFGSPQNLGTDALDSGVTPARAPGPLRPALKSTSSTPTDSAGPSRRSTLDSTLVPNGPHQRRSVSFSDGRMSGKIRGLSIRDIANDTPSEATSLTLSPMESEAAPSSRMQRIGNLLDALEDDSVLANLSIAPKNQPPGDSDEDDDTTEQFDIGRGDPDVDPDVSRNPRGFARTYSFGSADRGTGKGNATFLTECSFGVAHDRLVELITDAHPYLPHWESLGEIDLSKKGIESLARLKEFLPNLDRLNVHGNELAYLSGVPTCLRELNASRNQLTSLTSYAHLINLEVLDISNNQVDSIAQLKCLRHLRELSAAGNTISDLSGIAQNTSLVKLNLKGNCLKSLSLEECSWPHIENIDFSGNGMKSIAGLSNVPTLVTLNLDHNALTSLCIDAPLSRLRNLRLSDNRLTELDCSAFINLRTLYVDNNRLGTLRHIDRARRLENLSLRNQNGRGLHLSVSHIRDIKRLYLSGNPLDPGFLEVPCYNLVYLELAACRLSTLPSDLPRLVPNLRVLNLNYNFLTDARPLGGLTRLRKLTVIGSRLKATKPLLRSLQSMKELEMLDFRMNPFSLGWYLPLLVRDVPGALQPSETTGKNGPPWSDLDVKFRRDLPDELYIGRLAYRGLVMRVCPQLRTMDGIEITGPERAKAQKLLSGIEKSHKANLNPVKD